MFAENLRNLVYSISCIGITSGFFGKSHFLSLVESVLRILTRIQFGRMSQNVFHGIGSGVSNIRFVHFSCNHSKRLNLVNLAKFGNDAVGKLCGRFDVKSVYKTLVFLYFIALIFYNERHKARKKLLLVSGIMSGFVQKHRDNVGIVNNEQSL